MTQPAAGVTVVVIPQPTVNGPLHIGHLSGPYLAADVASRAARARGERVLPRAGVAVPHVAQHVAGGGAAPQGAAAGLDGGEGRRGHAGNAISGAVAGPRC